MKLKTTKGYMIEGTYIPKNRVLNILEESEINNKMNEAFKSGSSLKVITTMLSVLSKRVGKEISLSEEGYNYSNEYGNFTSYFGLMGNEAIRINFSLGKSDKIVSCDYFDQPSINPYLTIEFGYADNIIQIVNAIEDVIVNDVTRNPLEESPYQKRKNIQERKAVAYPTVETWIRDNERVNTNLISNARLSNVYKNDFVPWSRENDEPKLSLPSFAKAVKEYIDLNRLPENKFAYNAKIKKGGSGEEAIVSEQDNKAYIESLQMTVGEKFEQLKQFVDLVIKGFSRGFLVLGPPGVGKSHNVLKAVKEAGIKPIYASGGFRDAKTFVERIFKNKDQLIILDDFDDALKKPEVINIMKALLDTNTQKPNQVSYLHKDFPSASEYNDMSPAMQAKRTPSTFLFEGSLILISNLPQSKIPAAILDRVLVSNMEFSKEELLAKIKNAINDFPPSTDLEIKLKVFNFLVDSLNNLLTINFRQFQKMVMLASTGVEDSTWQKWSFAMGLVKGKGGV